MKKLGLLFVLVALMYSCCIVPDTEIHYVDENFILTNKTEKEMVINGDTRNVRTWEIQRVIVGGDSVMVGEISDEGSDCGCGIITDELWYSKEVGDSLYFEYIRIERFHLSKDFTGLSQEEKPTMTPKSVTPEDIKATTIINMNELELEREILAKERELLTKERELEMLKDNLK